jgi:hypothetical protein
MLTIHTVNADSCEATPRTAPNNNKMSQNTRLNDAYRLG